jgi:D-tagatose-1,6-bisphosphate aldolase subunit GatZ/KbaZ
MRQNDSINFPLEIKQTISPGDDLVARNEFQDLLSAAGQRGITSVCSAHPWVIQAAAAQALEDGTLLLVEATCNQVNQDGGYTGMRPADFRAFVRELAGRARLPDNRLLLGGDHLGPHVWRKLPAEEAMKHAEVMIAQYVRAGFGKIHLDASMSCSGDPAILPDETIAGRAARLAKVAEASHRDGPRPLYIIGTEVPVPGGASQGHELAVTAPEAASRTLAIHKQAFMDAGLADAWSRVVGLVVQPGVEFDNVAVIDYDPAKARSLVRWRRENAGNIVFEAHSTDFQRPDAYKALVEDGFAILKVGPGVTFAMREAICALAEIEKLTVAPDAQSRILETAHAVMRDNPGSWRDYYGGSPAEQDVLLFNSYSDRIRYYWPDSRIEAAVAKLVSNLSAAKPPEILLSRYLPSQYRRVRAGQLARDPQALILDKIRDALRPYAAACRN